jgi:hypothetical protein
MNAVSSVIDKTHCVQTWWRDGSCDGPYFSKGRFDMKAYLMVLVVAGLCCLYSAGMAAYYLLPVNASQEKYIPGRQRDSPALSCIPSHTTMTPACAFLHAQGCGSWRSAA